MPADNPGINLCKVVMSGLALGYPLPVLLNWDGDFNRPEWQFAGTHIAKLESLLAVIEELLDNDPDAHEDDLALMIDAYDLWFQLPPPVLIQRFNQLNSEANERNRQLWEQSASHQSFPIPPPEQSIIVTTAKDCFPLADSGSDPHYELWPPSPMPTDFYGEGTDELTPPLWDSARKYRKIRPRCVNSGLIMGTMGAMRDSLRRCREKVEQVARDGRQLWSDQALFGEVIGDQEAWRTWVREMASTWDGSMAESVNSTSDEHVRRIAEEALGGVRFDFGIGLDYNFTTAPATCSAEEDGYFVKTSDTAAIKELSEKAGVPDGVRVEGVPPELSKSGLEKDRFQDVNWEDQSLYTDFFFGIAPVGIHHNAYIDGLKSWRLKNWWDKMWFYPRLRELVTDTLQSSPDSPRPLARVDDGDKQVLYQADKGARVTNYSPGKDSLPARFDSMEWDEICQKGSRPWYNELFGDDKGPLRV
jgi:hypothetical protein